MLPEDLRRAIDAETEALPLRDLRAAVADLAHAYRPHADSAPEPFPGPGRAHRLAYLVTRLPATYAALRRVFVELNRRCHDWQPASLLDLGSGPGTALWAARDAFPLLKAATLVERDAALASLGESLLTRAAFRGMTVSHVAADLRRLPSMPPADLVVLSYVAGELRSEAPLVIDRAWRLTSTAVAVVEPGTPAGFDVVRRAREQLVALGARIVAPCPHARACPMTPDDWCHFSVRLPRSSRHRQAKSADLGWEDEKYSYVVATRETGSPAPARILRHPVFRKGHVTLRICTVRSVEDSVVSKRDAERYHAARHTGWGDAWDGS